MYHLPNSIDSMQISRLILQSKRDWRQLINLCGQDFPISSNAQIESFTRALLRKSETQSIELPSSHDKYHRVSHRQRGVNEAPDGFGVGNEFDKEKQWFIAKDETYSDECARGEFRNWVERLAL